MVYYYYCYIGARQRGDVGKLFLLPLGVSRCEGEGRVTPETTEAYHKFCQKAFSEGGQGLISMTDGAPCYRCRCELCKKWFLEHYWVNHSRKPKGEFSRSQDVIGDSITFERKDGMAGTMTIDGEWGRLKEHLPKNCSAKTEEGRAQLDIFIDKGPAVSQDGVNE